MVKIVPIMQGAGRGDYEVIEIEVDPFVSELPVHDSQNDDYETLVDWVEDKLARMGY